MKAQILKILQMQEEGKLSKDQAAELLAMLADQAREKDDAAPFPAGTAGDTTGAATSGGATGPRGDGGGDKGPGAPCGSGGGGFSSASAAAAFHSLVDTAVGVGATVGRAATVWGGELASMVHRDEGGNSVTLSKVEMPRGEGYTFRGNNVNVSTLSDITLNQAEFCNNTFNASKVSHVAITRGKFSQCNVSGSSVSNVVAEGDAGGVALATNGAGESAQTAGGGGGGGGLAGIRGVTLNASKFVRAKLTGGSVIDTCVMQAAAVKDLDLSDHSELRASRINDSAITSLRLERAKFLTVGIERSRLNALTARDVTLDRVTFAGMLVTDTTIAGGTWTNTRFKRDAMRENLIQESRFENCSLTDCEFSGCIFRRTVLRNLNLKAVTVRNVDFTGMTLEDDEAFKKAAGV